jgi:NADP-dependent 3-hydroxy acid dehydrogenase YdfG
VSTILSGTAGTVLMTESFLPLLRRSERPDVVTLHAAKAGQGRYAEIMSQRLRPEGIRMIALYPPDFDNSDDAPRDGVLTARSVADCVLFAVNQPRDCFIRSFHFEPMPR